LLAWGGWLAFGSRTVLHDSNAESDSERKFPIVLSNLRFDTAGPGRFNLQVDYRLTGGALPFAWRYVWVTRSASGLLHEHLLFAPHIAPRGTLRASGFIRCQLPPGDLETYIARVPFGAVAITPPIGPKGLPQAQQERISNLVTLRRQDSR
jgi:hypothetical protein